MSHPPAERTAKQKQRCDGAGDTAPLDADTREVIDLNGSKYVNISSAAVRILGVSEGETLDVELYDDKYVITKTDG
jgi:hypothetical protein